MAMDVDSQETRLALRKIAEDQQIMHHDMTQAFNSVNNLFLDYIRQQDRKQLHGCYSRRNREARCR